MVTLYKVTSKFEEYVEIDYSIHLSNFPAFLIGHFRLSLKNKLFPVHQFFILYIDFHFLYGLSNTSHTITRFAPKVITLTSLCLPVTCWSYDSRGQNFPPVTHNLFCLVIDCSLAIMKVCTKEMCMIEFLHTEKNCTQSLLQLLPKYYWRPNNE